MGLLKNCNRPTVILGNFLVGQIMNKKIVVERVTLTCAQRAAMNLRF